MSIGAGLAWAFCNATSIRKKEKLRDGKTRRRDGMTALPLGSFLDRLFALRLRGTYSQGKKRSDNCQSAEQKKCISVGASSCLEHSDERWPGESSDIRDHADESYPGRRGRSAKALTWHHPTPP